MYHSLSYAFLLAGTAILTFQKEDILKAIEAMKDAYQLADKYRLSTWKTKLKTSLSVQDILSMTPVQRHAELIYAEANLLKAGLQILYDQNFLLAIKELIKAYQCHSIYKSLENYMLYMLDQAAKVTQLQPQEKEKEKENPLNSFELDGHLISGIVLGMAGFNLVLSAIPDFLLRLIEYVGFRGDRTLAMYYCRSIGGWDDYLKNNNNQSLTTIMQSGNEGLRRQFTDLILIGYNIILCKLTPLSHVDQELGHRVLDYHLKLYPNGMIFLAFKGRQLATQRKLESSKHYYYRALNAQQLWPQLQHICHWELGTLAMIEQDWKTAYEMFRILNQHSQWSKCVYTYLEALMLYLIALEYCLPGTKRDQLLKKSAKLMSQVTGLKQKIAGKSIFIEKFVARKARKFDLQGNRLLFPDLEFLLSIGALELMPATWIKKNLQRIDNTIQRLETSKSLYVYDDRCLSHLLRATLYRFLLEQEDDDDEEEEEEEDEIEDEMDEEDEALFKDPEYIFKEEEEQQQQMEMEKEKKKKMDQVAAKKQLKMENKNNSNKSFGGKSKILKLLGHDELRKHHPYKVRHRHSIQQILEMANQIQLDHWIYYFAVYEKAQLLLMDELYADAKHELDYILKCTEKKDFHVGAGLRAKSKYSMENALILKCHSCLGYINEQATKGTLVGKKDLASLLRYPSTSSSYNNKKRNQSNFKNESEIIGSGISSGFMLSPSTSLSRKRSL
ncbi:unnamed protein product [Cunninghamella echinulata]